MVKKNETLDWRNAWADSEWWVTVKHYQDQDGPIMGQIKGGPPEATSRTEDWTRPIKGAKNLWRKRFQAEQNVHTFSLSLSLYLFILNRVI